MSYSRQTRIGRFIPYAAALCVAGLALSNAVAATQEFAALSDPEQTPSEMETVPSTAPDPAHDLKFRRLCEAGFDIQTGSLTPEDASAHDNAPAAAVELNKKCRGPVLVRFTSGVLSHGDDDTVYVTVLAECLGTGGYADHCTLGEVHRTTSGSGGLQLSARSGASSDSPVRATQWVYSDLKPGVWKFVVQPAHHGEGAVTLHGRGLSVAAFQG